MAERTVSVKLRADVSEYTAGLAKAAAATRMLGDSVDKSMRTSMSRAGERSGGLLAKGINQGLVRNSPMIAAGIAAALSAGAPAVLAGAGVLFGGIGAIAAAQTDEVREAWTGLGHDIRDGAVSDVAVLVPAYVGMADKIGAAFQRMRPEIRDAFEAAAPQIDRFTEGLTNAAEYALPGLVRAVERGGPVIDGLATLMGDIGTGISDFLDAMSDNSVAAGAALEGLGNVLGEALPLLGELLGTGAEIAADVLPAMAGALGLVRDVVKALGPALAPVVTGFIAFKVASTAAGFLNTFTAAAQRAGVASTGVGTAVLGAGRAMPLLAVATGLATAAISKGAEGERKFEAAVLDATRRLAEGGVEGRKAAHELEVLKQVAEESGGKFLGMGADMEGAFKRGQQAARDLGYQQETLAQATERATAAMSAQADATLAAANSSLGYRQAQDQLQQAETDLATAIRDHGAASEEAADAVLQVESAVLRQAEAAGIAQADLAGLTEGTNRNAYAQAAQLVELTALRNVMGSSFPAALNTTIGRLSRTTDTGMVTAAQFARLGAEVIGVPNSKYIDVKSPTQEQIRQFETLGYRIETLPDGNVRLYAETQAAEAALNYAARDRTSTVHLRTVNQQAGRGYTGLTEYATGGFTGHGAKYQVAGLVHRGEFVVTKEKTAQHRPLLEAIHRGAPSYASGGEVGALRGLEFSGGHSGGAPSIDYRRLGAELAAAVSRPDLTIQTSDNPRAILRALEAQEQQRAALAPSW